jgi:hypothetical protein
VIYIAEVLSRSKKPDKLLGYTYSIALSMSNGTTVALSGVPVIDPIGSIKNSVQVQLSASEITELRTTVAAQSTLGSRVIVACPNNSLKSAIIIGCLSHPNRQSRATEESHYYSSIQGLTTNIDKDGLLMITKMPPTETKDYEGVFAKKTADESSDASLLKSLGMSLTVDKDNKVSIVTQTKQNLVLSPKDNSFSYKDSAGNGISFDGRGNTVKIDSKLKMELTAGQSKLVMDGSTISLGGPTAELLDLFDQFLDAFTKAAPKMVQTAVGPGIMDPELLVVATKVKKLLGTIKK